MGKIQELTSGKKTKFSVLKMNNGGKVACRSVCFTPKEVTVKNTHLRVLLQHGFDDKENPAPLHWHRYELNGQFWNDTTCGMDLVIINDNL